MIVIVLGMHRSGTSALAGLLHRSGVAMGRPRDFLPRASEENRKGYYENIRFRRLNDRILEREGYVVKEWPARRPWIRPSAAHRRRARRLLRAFDRRFDHWGFKDPRTCPTLHVRPEEARRTTLLPSCRGAFIWRNPARVAESMVRGGDTSRERAIATWISYSRQALEAIDGFRLPTYFLTYEALIRDPRASGEGLRRHLGLDPVPDAELGFIDRALDRSRQDENAAPLPRDLRREMRDLECELERRTRESGSTSPPDRGRP